MWGLRGPVRTKVSGLSLPKTGVFRETAGDFRRFARPVRRIGVWRRKGIREKPESPARSRVSRGAWPNSGLAGWGGRNRTSIWRSRNRMLLPVREELQNPHCPLNSQVSPNTRISRAVPNPQSPELWREMSHSEKKARILPLGGPELQSEIAANTGVNHQHPPAEKRWLRRSWRREWDSHPTLSPMQQTH